MGFVCKNGTPHTHETRQESRDCWAGRGAGHTRSVTVNPTGPITERQLWYLVNRLSMPEICVKHLTKQGAHELIDELKGKTPTYSHTPEPGVTAPPTPAPRPVTDPRIEMLAGLMTLIPKGYYAVGENGDEGHLDFIRITRPVNGKYKGSVKIQSQHGDRLEVRGALWPSGKLSIYDRRYIDPLMLLDADHLSAAIRYGQKLGHCCRCNAELTDERSRRLTIGPECEKLWPAFVEEVESRLASA